LEAAREGDWFVINGFVNSVLGGPFALSQENLLIIRSQMVRLYIAAKANNHTNVMDECLRIPEVKETVVMSYPSHSKL